MFRNLIKTGTAHALHWTGAERLMHALMRPQPLVVIGYHRVVENFALHSRLSIPAMLVSRVMLERHLDWYGRRFTFVSLDEAGALLESGERCKRPALALSFDDGYRDFYDIALPVLKRKGIPAAVFVTTDLTGTGELHAHDHLYLLIKGALAKRSSQALARLLWRLGIQVAAPADPMSNMTCLMLTRSLLESLPRRDIERVIAALAREVQIRKNMLEEFQPLTWDMLREIHNAGFIIGSHTKRHALLPNETSQGMQEEAAGSRNEIEKRLGIEVQHFAYPSGYFNHAAVEAVANSGYRFAYTCCRHRDMQYPLLTIPRKVMWENSCLDAFGRFSSEILSCQMNGIFDLVAGCRQDHESPSAVWTDTALRAAGARRAVLTGKNGDRCRARPEAHT